MGRRLPACVLGVLITSMVSSAHAQSSPIHFKDRTDVPADAAPSDVVVADLDNDGKMDLAVANSDAANVIVRLGDGQGAFTAASTPFTVGDSPMSLAVAYVNADIKPDLLVANDLSDNVSVLLGTGTSALFGNAMNSDTGAEPVGVVTGNFDGDGKLDMATADQLDQTVTVQFGKQDGTFQNTRSYAVPAVVPADPAGLAVGDVVGDSALDLVVSVSDGDLVNLVVVLQGNHDGTFEVPDCTADPLPAACIAVGLNPSGVTVGDLNDDHKLDIVVANRDDDTVSVLLNNGDGSFTPQANLDSGVFSYPTDVAIADFDQDGKPDIVSVNSSGGDTGDGDVTVFHGNGDGTFEGAAHFATGGAPAAVAAADVNGDGFPDIFTANGDTNDVSVLLNDSARGCTGDCDSGGTVSVDELVKGVNIALSIAQLDSCPAFDKDHDKHVTVDELVIAVNNALGGCTQ